VCKNCFKEVENGIRCPHCNFLDGDTPKEAQALLPGTILVDGENEYMIGGLLGAGGFGMVYKSLDLKTNEIVAIKELFPGMLVTRIPGEKDVLTVSDDENTLDLWETEQKRFHDEAMETANIASHFYRRTKAVMKFCKYFTANDTGYMVTEYLEGKTLSAIMDGLNNQPLEYDESMRIIREVLIAVQCIHSADILHLDINPENIFVCDDGQVKLIDYGSAKSQRNLGNDYEPVLKPGYAPPEQYISLEETKEFSDIYAIGATLYFMLTAKKPIESTNKLNETVKTQEEDLYSPVEDSNKAVPKNISNAIWRAMAIDPRLRFQTAKKFLKALKGRSKIEPPLTYYRKRRKNIFLGITSTFVVLILAGITAYFYVTNISLNPATFEVWLVSTGNPALDTQREAAFDEIINSFLNAHPDVELDVELRIIPQESFASEVEDALRQGLPILFESNGIDENLLLSYALDLSSVASTVSSRTHFLSDFSRLVPSRAQIPTGFKTSAIFINSTFVDFDEESVSDLPGLLASMPVSVSAIAVYPGAESGFASAFGSTPFVDSSAFFEGSAGAIFAYTSSFHSIQGVMAGRYRMLSLDINEVPASFGGFFAAVNSSGNENRAIMRLLEFILGEDGQDLIHIRNSSGFVPINIAALEIYQSVFTQFDSMFDNKNSYVFD